MTQREFFKRYQYDLREDKLGGGAFGTVYKAYDNVLDRTVAIKIAEVKTFGEKTFSLLDEFKAIQELPPHVNIANYEQVYTFEQPNGVFDYAVIQYYPHGTLKDIIKNEKLSQKQKEDIALQILNGLEFLHNHNVVHRDMKPSNILIHKRKNGEIIPKIADFGLSKKSEVTAQSRFTNSFGGGTLEYSSPEQLKGQTLRFNTDLWAWAVIVYELFTGKMLFQPKGNHSTGSAEREKELFEQILSKTVNEDLFQLPTKWHNVLPLCLEKNPNKRIKTAQQIKEILGEKNTQTQVLKEEKTQVLKIEEKIKKTKIKIEEKQPDSEGKNGKGIPPRYQKRWIGLGVIILLLGGIWFFTQSKTVMNSSNSIEINEAKQQFYNFQYAKIGTDMNAMETLFTHRIRVFYRLNNITFYEVRKDVEKYYKKWNVKSYQLQDFYKIKNNMFHYDMLYTIQGRKTGKFYEYSISGKIGFEKENGEWKINYIKDMITKKIRTYH